jgi:hypothetical protein
MHAHEPKVAVAGRLYERRVRVEPAPIDRDPRFDAVGVRPGYDSKNGATTTQNARSGNTRIGVGSKLTVRRNPC